MKYFYIYLSLLTGCGSGGEKKGPFLEKYRTSEIIDVVTEARNNLLMKDGIFIFSDNKDNANYNLFGSLLCYSGENWACEQIHRLQKYPILCRNPWECGEIVGGKIVKNEASRDEYLGRLLYWGRTKDYFIKDYFIKDNTASNYIINDRICNNPTDDRCDVNFIHVGILAILKRLDLIKGNILGHEVYTLALANSSELGYRLHLQAVTILIYQMLNMCTFSRCPTLTKTLIKRDANNEFYQYLAGNKKLAIDLFLEHSKKINYKVQSQWYLQRDSKEQSWTKANAACIIFIGNLLIKD